MSRKGETPKGCAVLMGNFFIKKICKCGSHFSQKILRRILRILTYITHSHKAIHLFSTCASKGNKKV